MPRARPAPPFPEPLVRLLDEVALGAVHLGADGEVVSGNAAAHDLLEGSAGAELAAALAALARASRSPSPVGEATLPSARGEVRAFFTRSGGGFLALLDRDSTRRLRDQALALRGMLAAAVEARPDDPGAAIRRSLEALAAVIRDSRLRLFAAGPWGELSELARARGPGAGLPWSLPELPGEGEDLARRAVATGYPVHVPRIPRAAPFRRQGEPLAAMAIPARDQGTVVGALFAVGPRLGEGELRLIAGLADAAGALIGRARARAALQAAEARAERARTVALEREGLATLGHLAACVTHEIAGPLACLGSNLGALRDAARELTALAATGPGAARAAELAREVEQTLANSGGDLERVADLARSVRGLSWRRAERVRFDPRHPVQDAVRIFKGARRAEVRLEAPPSLPQVEGSPGLLCQVVLNLLDNGLDAMGGHGSLMVRLGGAAGEWLRLEVEDRGAGIAPEVQERIFEAYVTTKPPGQGTGLGLYLARDVVERMGGRIAFESGPEGTTFRVLLPPAP